MMRTVFYLTLALTIFFTGVLAGLAYASWVILYPPPMMPVGVLWL